MIVIIDYHTGNLRSVQNMLKRLGHPSLISNTKEAIENSTKLILPGVGSFDHGMEKLKELGLTEILHKKVIHDKTPLLGICLGAQLLAQSSEEGNIPGLGWFNANVLGFDKQRLGDRLKVPHMSWAEVDYNKNSKLFTGFEETPRFYFVHSFHLQSEIQEEILATAEYGYRFIAALEKENIVAVQFHPEKSHKFGMQLLKNFIENY